MYYKVVKDDKIIDVLDRLIYLKYQAKHNTMLLCNLDEAQAILSSDEETLWHEESLYDIPVPGYSTVRIEEIDEYDYKRLKAFNGRTVEDVIDNAVVEIIVNGYTTMLIDSLKRLYTRQEIGESKVIEICDAYNIADECRKQILT